MSKPSPLYEAVVEVDERVLLAEDYALPNVSLIAGSSGEKLQVERGIGECELYNRY